LQQDGVFLPMKNLWRIAILFMLPGMIGSGGTAMAFFRLADADVPMLNTVSLAAILWCAVYCLGMFALRKERNLTWLYYTGTMMIALAFTCGLGIVRLLGGSGWLEGVAGLIISAAAASVWQHCFCSGSFRWPDRLSWLAGVIAALLAIFYLFSRNRMAWLETLFFYLGEMLLVFWAMASPLTLYGTALKRWSFRLGLLGVGLWRYGSVRFLSSSRGTVRRNPCRMASGSALLLRRKAVVLSGSIRMIAADFTPPPDAC